MRKSILYALTGAVIGFPVAILMAGLLFSGVITAETVPGGNGRFEYIDDTLLLTVVVTVFFYAFCTAVWLGYRYGKRREQPDRKAGRKDYVLSLLWVLIFLLPFGTFLLVGALQQRRSTFGYEQYDQRRAYENQLLRDYEHVSKVEARLRPDGKAVDVRASIAGNRAAQYDLHAEASNCSNQTVKWDDRVDLPAGETEHSFELTGAQFREGEGERQERYKPLTWVRWTRVRVWLHPTLKREEIKTLLSFKANSPLDLRYLGSQSSVDSGGSVYSSDLELRCKWAGRENEGNDLHQVTQPSAPAPAKR